MNLYRQYWNQAPWNSKARIEWLTLAVTEEMNEAVMAGRKFSIIAHKPQILEAKAAGRDWYAIAGGIQ